MHWVLRDVGSREKTDRQVVWVKARGKLKKEREGERGRDGERRGEGRVGRDPAPLLGVYNPTSSRKTLSLPPFLG